MKKISKQQEIIFMAMVSLFWFAQYIYIPYQTTFLSALGVTSSLIGMIVGAYGIAQLILRFPIGLMADSVGKQKQFIIIGCLAAGIASLIRFFWPSGIGFFIANLLSGLASSMWISFMVYYANCFDSQRQQMATSRIILFNNVGMLFGFILSTVLYEQVGMRMLCILSSIGGFVAFLLGLLLKENTAYYDKMTCKERIMVCKNKRILLFAVIALIQQGIQLSTTMSFTTQILKELGASALMVGFASIIYMVSAVCFSGFASSKQCVKRGAKFWIPFVLIVVAIYCVLVPAMNSIVIIFLLQILPGMSTGILFSYATSEAMKEVPIEKKSTAMGFFQAVYALGMTTFPILTGTVAAHFSLQISYHILALISLVGSALVIRYYKNFK